ncbi:unnamed protein product [Linum tenue]|uniref:non-specific serine/threonine protein kinase n=1 Tax=Linum tenue TaxID=586396 RepID=A0AAV0JKK7_9ROSI|nr:unnamed protein product [Linum tenue]
MIKQTHSQCLPSCHQKPPLHRHLLVLLLASITSVVVVCQQATASSNDTDRLALLHFKQGITDDPNMILSSWNDSLHFCSWFGVTCNSGDTRVMSLSLDRQHLVGTLSPYIGNLTSLQGLGLIGNTFLGEIPQQLGNLLLLRHLNLSDNLFTGEIPLNLTRCFRLNFLLLKRNNLTGPIPPEIGTLNKLEYMQLGINNLTGELPPSLGNLSMLIEFHVAYNWLVGSIPESYGRISSLKMFVVGVNQLSGIVPESLYNLSSLNMMTLTVNQFQGDLPRDIAYTLPNLQMFAISRNAFTGYIPASFCNASKLLSLNMNYNHFQGRIPDCLGNVPTLKTLDAAANNLGSNSTGDFAFLKSLVNCSHLTRVGVSLNNLGGQLPESLANFSASTFKQLYLGVNQATGFIPEGLGNLIQVAELDLTVNHFTGPIPSFLGKLTNLQRVELSGNQLSGRIPSSIGNLTKLFEIDISFNELQGNLPSDIVRGQKLDLLDVSSNKLDGMVPPEIMQLATLSILLNLSRNSFTGHLPGGAWKLQSLTSLDLSHNNFTGEIPAVMGGCKSLVNLYLQSNSFTGKIPDALASLGGIEQMDLSHNSLTGRIPLPLQNIHGLKYLNLSFNDLGGEVPTGGVFSNTSALSLAGANVMLCGGVSQLHLPKCGGTQRNNTKRSLKVKLLTIMVPSLFLSILVLGGIFFYYMSRRRSNKKKVFDDLALGKLVAVSYKDLHQATNGFSAANSIGSGGFGMVFKGVLEHTGTPVAIKVLRNGDNKVDKSLKAECKALKNVRHRNLVRLITFCSSLDYKGNNFNALVYQFMENGSLEKWLHHSDDDDHPNLSMIQRINIALDVATALHYLHELNGGGSIIHCDLKPSNVLLDADMVAHVSDFGLAKLLSVEADHHSSLSGSKTSSLGVRGTIGYAPPEYGMSATTGTKEGDVYSYGILVLEMMSRKRPTDEMFGGGGGAGWLNLRDAVKAALPNDTYSVLDPKLYSPEDRDAAEAEDRDEIEEEEEEDGNVMPTIRRTAALQHRNYCFVSVLEIGVACAEESPRERMKIDEVARKLLSVRDYFLVNCVNSSRARQSGHRE